MCTLQRNRAGRPKCRAFFSTNCSSLTLSALTTEGVGGVYGEVYWGWLNILVLWVAPALRRHGVGTQLLAHVETEAVAKSCRGIYLDTFTFQNPQLYLRAGYEVFGTLDQFPNGHSRHFLRKQLHAA